MKNLLLLLFLILVFCYTPLYAQKTKQDLENERKAQQKKIEDADRILQKTRDFKQQKLGALTELNGRITQRNELMNTILQEVPIIDKEIMRTDSALKANEKQLEKLKTEYAEMIYLSSKTKNSMEKLSFMFSSESFNQLMARLNYLRQYDEERKKQIKYIKQHQKNLVYYRKQLENQKIEKADLLSAYQNQKRKLDELQKDQVLLLNSLKNREKELFIEIENRKKAITQLEKCVNEAITRVNKIENNLGDNQSKRTPESIIVASKSFAEAKGKLIWPVKEGYIVGKFGKQKHPVLENILIDNLGIDIYTNEGEEVRAIYDGQVIAITKVLGNFYMVLVQHGDFFTVYAQLQNVKIRIGQKIKAREAIGSVGKNQEGLALLQFQVWQNKKRLNPEEWLTYK
jgi:murein hydrolase activator